MAESGEVTREETVDGIKLVYHQRLNPLGWIDKKRVIHLADPEYVAAVIKNHELVHYRRWNKPTMRCYRFSHTPVGWGALFAFFIPSLALALLKFTVIPVLLATGLWIFYNICYIREENIAMKEAEKMTCADKINGGETIGNRVSNNV